MNKYRFLPTSTWSDDTFLNMSPEQKLIYLYLMSSPYTSLCGIFKLSISTMGHFIGLRNGTIESAFKGFLLAYSDWVQFDESTGEVALLYWPKFALVNANIKAKKKAESDLEDVKSIPLLQAVIKRNSATLSKMYLSRLRQIQVEKLNLDRIMKSENYVDVPQGTEIQGGRSQREIEREKENIVSDSDEIGHSPKADELNDTGTSSQEECSAAAPTHEYKPPHLSAYMQPKDMRDSSSPDEFSDWFWETYNHKVGKAKCFAKLKKLSKKDRAEIRRTLPFYIADTVKQESDQHGGFWRPRRKNPLTYLNGRTWDDYAEADGPMIKAGRGNIVRDGKALPRVRLPENKPFSIADLPD